MTPVKLHGLAFKTLARISKRLSLGQWTSETLMLRRLQDPRAYGMERWKRFLRSCFVPSIFYDIGANDPYAVEGQQTVFKPLMPDTRFYLFEAMEKHQKALARSGEPYAVVLLGENESTERSFYQSGAYAPGTGDSYYRERTKFYDDSSIITTKRVTRRLDDVVRDLKWPMPDFIKLDTQGSEIDILRGAPSCLAHARGLQIECNILEYNEGAPLIAEVISFVNAAGFRLYDIVQFHFDPNKQLLQADLLFVRAELFGNE